jgi:hypothetical protein
MYAVILDWDAQNKVSRYNYVDTEEEAQRIVNRLTGKPVDDVEREQIEAKLTAHADPSNPLSLSEGQCLHCKNRLVPVETSKLSPNAFYIEMAPLSTGSVGYEHRAQFWEVDPVAKTISFDDIACANKQRRHTYKQIDHECKLREKEIYPGEEKLDESLHRQTLIDKDRSNWTPDDKAWWDASTEKSERVFNLRARADTLKSNLANKTANEVRATIVKDEANWTAP